MARGSRPPPNSIPSKIPPICEHGGSMNRRGPKTASYEWPPTAPIRPREAAPGPPQTGGGSSHEAKYSRVAREGAQQMPDVDCGRSPEAGHRRGAEPGDKEGGWHHRMQSREQGRVLERGFCVGGGSYVLAARRSACIAALRRLRSAMSRRVSSSSEDAGSAVNRSQLSRRPRSRRPSDAAAASAHPCSPL